MLAGKLFGIPVHGTHAHSWVMSFDDELKSFQAYAEAHAQQLRRSWWTPTTRSTACGDAVEVGQRLRSQGHEMVGIRLDSGDLA